MKNRLIETLLLSLPLSVAAQERPNIILFLVDDMGVMDTSLPFLTDAEGNVVRHPLNDWYHTPNMEKLAQQGVRFSTFYAQSVSSPSRASGTVAVVKLSIDGCYSSGHCSGFTPDSLSPPAESRRFTLIRSKSM